MEPRLYIYTRVQKESRHYIFASNFVKCGLIFKIHSQTDLAVNFWQSNNY